MVRRAPAQGAPTSNEPYPADKARGGEVILNTPLKRWVFFGGLAGAVLLALVLSIFH